MSEQQKPMTLSELRSRLASTCELSVDQVKSVLDALASVAIEQTNITGTFTLPGLVKINKVDKPATEAGVKISPFTKKEVKVEAKPAYSVVKVKALKYLKEAVSKFHIESK
jgi:nucleoid DNA-binding protein